MKTIVIAQQKGGTGKSTTAQNIGAGLAMRGGRVLYVDLDPQTNLSFILGAQGGKLSALDVMQGKTTIKAAAAKIDAKRDVLRGSAYLYGADATITGAQREYRLAAALKDVARHYDYCVIDTPPALGILTINALTAADVVIVPCLTDVLSIQALGQIAETIAGVQSTSNKKMKIAGLLVTRFTPRQTLTRDTLGVLEKAAAQMGTRVLNTHIRETVSLREAQALGKDIFAYNPRSAGAEDYNKLIEEIF